MSAGAGRPPAAPSRPLGRRRGDDPLPPAEGRLTGRRAKPLTAEQRRVLDHVTAWKAEEEYGPTIAEIATAMSMNRGQTRVILDALRRRSSVWNHGAGATAATCWHPDPPRSSDDSDAGEDEASKTDATSERKRHDLDGS